MPSSTARAMSPASMSTWMLNPESIRCFRWLLWGSTISFSEPHNGIKWIGVGELDDLRVGSRRISSLHQFQLVQWLQFLFKLKFTTWASNKMEFMVGRFARHMRQLRGWRGEQTGW